MISLRATDLAIDLGTANTHIITLDKSDRVLSEPTVVALDIQNQDIVAFGEEAYEMVGKTPKGLQVVFPLEDGVISDFDLANTFLKQFMTKADPGLHLIRPSVTISIPTRITDVERRALEDCCIESGAREVVLLEQPLAAAMGAGISTQEAIGNMVVCLGAGLVEAAIVSLDGIVSSRSSLVAGRFLDREIARYIKETHELMIGPQMAEKLKNTLVNVHQDTGQTMKTHGRDLRSGLPKIIDVHEHEIFQVLEPYLAELVNHIIAALETTPPELSSDILRRGILLTGGMAKMKGLLDLLQEAVQIPVHVAKQPEHSVVMGCAMDRKQQLEMGNKKYNEKKKD